jgi:hypothetical protein
MMDDMIEYGLPKEKMVTTAQNKKNRQRVLDEWKLGPDRASVDPKANAPYWRDLGKALGVDEKEARRRLCANCGYFKNGPMKQAMMESIPLDRFDMDGGGRGLCKRFSFICHNLRSCQAWEEG